MDTSHANHTSAQFNALKLNSDDFPISGILSPAIDCVDSSDVTITDNTKYKQVASHHFIHGPDGEISVRQSDINEADLQLDQQLQSELTKRPDYKDTAS